MAAGGLNSAATANSKVDLPQPDSPTTPTNSPLRTSRSTLSTAHTGPREVLYSTRKPDTSRMGALDTYPPDRPQSRVADLVERVVEQREGCSKEGDADTRGDGPYRVTALEGAVVLRPIQHGAPAERRRIAKPEELETSRGKHRIECCAKEVRHDQRRHRRQQLGDDDVRPSFPPHSRRL